MVTGPDPHGADFDHPGICWRYRTAWHKQSRRFLECISHDYLMMYEKMLKEPCLFSLGKRKLSRGGELTVVFTCKMSGCKEHKAMYNKKLTGNGYMFQQGKLQLCVRKKRFFQKEHSDTAVDCLENVLNCLWNLHLWRYPKHLGQCLKKML